MRGFLRQLMDHGVMMEEGVVASRAIFILESNAGMQHIVEEAEGLRAGGKAQWQVESYIKDLLFERWAADDSCARDALDVATLSGRALSLVDQYVPFLPLTRPDVRDIVEAYLRHLYRPQFERATRHGLTWGSGVVDFLADRVEYASGAGGAGAEIALEGAAGVPRLARRFMAPAADAAVHPPPEGRYLVHVDVDAPRGRLVAQAKPDVRR